MNKHPSARKRWHAHSQPDMPPGRLLVLTKTVPIDGGEATVGRLTWQAWCRIKTRLAETLGNRLLTTALQQIGETASAEAIVQWLTSESFRMIPKLIAELSQALDSLTLDLISGCVTDSQSREWSAVDVLALREAALEVNDFEALLRAEKNFIGEVVGTVAGRLANATASLSGSDGSTSSPEATDGLQA